MNNAKRADFLLGAYDRTLDVFIALNTGHALTSPAHEKYMADVSRTMQEIILG